MIKSISSLLVLVILIFGNARAQSLETYINTAIQKSPLLYENNNQLLAGRLDSLLILATFKPQINQVSQAMYSPTGNGWGYDDAITNGGNYSATVNLIQPLFNKKQINGQLQTIDLLNQTLKLNQKITVFDLKKGITAQYLTAYYDFSLHQFNVSTLSQLVNEQKTVKALVDKGVYLITDYMNLQVLITSQKITISQSFIQMKNDIAVLNYICGISGENEINLLKPEIALRNDPNPESSPLFAQFKIDSLKNQNSLQLIDLNYRPRISAFADAGFNAVTPENIPHNLGTGFGLNFSIPIYDGKQRKLQYDKINLAENSRIFYKNYYSSQYKLQSDQLINQLRLTENLISEINNQLTEQQRLIELYRIELDKGLVRFLDYLTILNNYNTTKNTLLITEINRLQIINQLNYLK
jgi:outer membrane protein TolC